MIQVMFNRCAGLDVHKGSVVATIISQISETEVTQIQQTFGTTQKAGNDLVSWLKTHQVELSVMESTGVYWQSVYRKLEANQLPAIVVNARHVKQVPGHKTDIGDSAWLAEVARHGLVKASFVPPEALRELRLLTRQRSKLSSHQSSLKNRIHKILDDAGIRLGTELSDVLGKSGRKLIEGLIKKESVDKMISQISQRLRHSKEEALREILAQPLGETHRFVLSRLLAQLDGLHQEMRLFDEAIKTIVEQPPYREYFEILQTIPGIDVIAAAAILAEIGIDMPRFRSNTHFCSWAALCPGNNESGGKRKSGKTRKGNFYLRKILCEVAWAAAKTKGCQFNGFYHGLVLRRGHKRAIVAVAHKILRVIFSLFKQKKYYQDPAINYEAIVVGRNAARWLRKLQEFGYLNGGAPTIKQ